MTSSAAGRSRTYGLLSHVYFQEPSQRFLRSFRNTAFLELLKELGETTAVEEQLVELGKQATPYVLRYLETQTDDTRESACRILGRLRDKSARDQLIERVDDLYPGVRREAIIVLLD